MAATLAAVGLAGCGDTPGDAGAPADTAVAGAAVAGEQIVIKTSAELIDIVDTGKVLDGSTISGSRFCPRGTWRGGHGRLANDWLDKNFKCPEGTLRIAFDPSTSKGLTDSGPWKVLSGTGAYEGWRGSGRMKMEFDPGSGDPPTEGHETFTGTIAR